MFPTSLSTYCLHSSWSPMYTWSSEHSHTVTESHSSWSPMYTWSSEHSHTVTESHSSWSPMYTWSSEHSHTVTESQSMNTVTDTDTHRNYNNKLRIECNKRSHSFTAIWSPALMGIAPSGRLLLWQINTLSLRLVFSSKIILICLSNTHHDRHLLRYRQGEQWRF